MYRLSTQRGKSTPRRSASSRTTTRKTCSNPSWLTGKVKTISGASAVATVSRRKVHGTYAGRPGPRNRTSPSARRAIWPGLDARPPGVPPNLSILLRDIQPHRRRPRQVNPRENPRPPRSLNPPTPAAAAPSRQRDLRQRDVVAAPLQWQPLAARQHVHPRNEPVLPRRQP